MQRSLKFLFQSCTRSIRLFLIPSSVSGISSLAIFLFFLTLFSPHLCLAVDVSLGWTANAPEENVQGYKIYAGTASRYDDNQQLKNNFHYQYVIDLNTKLSCSLPDMDNCVQLSNSKLSCADLDQENPTCTFLNLAENTAFYFTATAFSDISESDYSDEAAYLPTTPETDFCSTASFGEEWHTVPIPAEVGTPVVIVGPPSYNGSDPGVVRLQNVTDNSFDIRFQEWDYLDGLHMQEEAAWLALESGRYLMADGTICEVGTFVMDGTGEWFDVNFQESFDGVPALFLTIQTSNGGNPVTVRARGVGSFSFSAAFFEEEEKMDSGHAAEIVGYLAFYSPYSSGTITINGQSVVYEMDSVVASDLFEPVFDYEIFMEEEESEDIEVSHAYETVNVLRLNNSFFSQDVSTLGGDPAAIRFQKIE